MTRNAFLGLMVVVFASCSGGVQSGPGSAASPGINLVPVALALSPQAPQPGDQVTFSAQVKNAGDTDLVDGQLGVLFTVNGTEVVWYSVTPTTTIRAGQTATLSSRGGPSGSGTWSAGPAGTYSLKAVVDDQKRIAESDDSDNAMSLTFTVGNAPSDSTPPSVPTGLSSSDIAATRFTLSWSPATDNVGVTGYEAFRDGASIGTTASTSISVTGLSASTTYAMEVRARDAAGNWSNRSTALSVTTTIPSTGNPPTPADFPTRTSVGPTTEPTQVYQGDCYFDASDNGTVIDGKIIDCTDTGVRFDVNAANITIRNSIIRGGLGTIGNEPATAAGDTYPRDPVFTVEDSRIIQESTVGGDRAACCAHFVIKRSLIQGTHSGIGAHNNVTLIGNFITTDGTDTHQSGLRALKNTVIRGNTITCKPVAAGYEGSGCSAHGVFYREDIGGNPVPAYNLTIENNYFKRGVTADGQDGGPYYGTRFIDCQAHDDCVNIRFTGNMFSLGEGTDGGEFPNDAGDVWENNWWVDGQPALSNTGR